MSKKKYAPGDRVSIYLKKGLPVEILEWLNVQSNESEAVLKVLADFIIRNGIHPVTQEKSTSLSSWALPSSQNDYSPVTIYKPIEVPVKAELASLATSPPPPSSSVRNEERENKNEHPPLPSKEERQINTGNPNEGSWKGVSIEDEDDFM